MNSMPNFFYPYGYEPAPIWYNQYLNQNPDYYTYYNHHYYSGPQISYGYKPQVQKPKNSQLCAIKIEDNNSSNSNKQKDNGKQQQSKKQRSDRKKYIPKRVLKGQENIYLHPSKQVNHKVRYFDPCAAPVITTPSYHFVEDMKAQIQRTEQLQRIPVQHVNQLKFPEKFQQKFIVFKYRRIKKRFKRYIKTENDNCLSKNNTNSQQQQSDQQDLSEQGNSVKYQSRRENFKTRERADRN